MWSHFNCMEAVQLFFMLATFIFGIILLIFIHRINRLKQKMSRMVGLITSKDKEVDTLKEANQNILSPFIPETSRSIIMSIDTKGCISDINDYAAEIFEYSKSELIGKNVFGTIFPIQSKDASHHDLISRIFSNPKLYVEYETENIKKSGEHFWISWTNRVIYDKMGKPTEIRAVGFDITKRKNLEEELTYLTSIDSLTGVLNHQAFLETAQHELKRALRYGRNMSVMIIRFDYFKSPDLPPNFSDDILRNAISLIRSNLRESDCIGRIGDVEFAIILPEATVSEVKPIESRILKKIQEENLKEANNFYLTVYFGISDIKSKNETVDSLILKALGKAQPKTPKKKRGA